MRLSFPALATALAVLLAGCASVPSFESLARIGGTLHADPAFGSFEHRELTAMMASAKTRLAGFYGPQRASDPDVIYCKTDACAVYFAGPEKRSRALSPGRTSPGGTYRAARPTVVITRVGSTAENVLTHELSHIEHHTRFGPGRAPTWFHEGVAVHMSGEPNCDNLPPESTNHLAAIVAGADWTGYTNDRGRLRATYCQAAAEIGLWIDRRGGKAALLDLIEQVRRGKSFEDVYGPLLTVKAGS